MEHPILRAGDIGHHRLGVIDDHPSRNPTKEGQRPHKSIQHHLLALTGVGNDKWFAAVAQTKVGNLHLLFDATQNNPFFAPIKLEGITGSEVQRNERISRSGIGALEIPDKTLNRRIGSSISLRDELFVELYRRPALSTRALLILLKKLLKSRVKSIAQLMPNRRRLSLVAWRTVVLQIFFDCVPRQTGCPCHRPDAAPLHQDPTSNLRYTFH